MRILKLLVLLVLTASGRSPALNLTKASVVVPARASALEAKAATVLVEEVEKQTGIRWNSGRQTVSPAIVLGTAPGPADGYRIEAGGDGVRVTGFDSRGLLFGVGRLLRELRMWPGRVELPDGFSVTSAPKYKLRGHQLGYRAKTNSYDGWNVAMWEQYIRDLAVFGANAIELIPPGSDDERNSPHFPIPPMPVMREMARIASEYGMEVWVWYPALDGDYSKREIVERSVKAWEDVLRQLPRLDAVFVPGGDPGRTPPRHLFPLLETQARNIRKYHPKATMWMSPQSFSKECFDEFLQLVRAEPAWLAGIVHGPEVRVSAAELRRLVPRRYPIRNYPDITHSTHAQFVVPDWDVAHALTHGREPINPRPRDSRASFRDAQNSTIGFITYSEGCNDDVNKAIWSALGWDLETDVEEALRQYSRYFIGAGQEEAFTQAVLALEDNWRGPLATNGGVYTTLEQFQAIERSASPRLLLNWRFQMALYRAYYDAYNRRRLLHETAIEETAMDRLRDALRTGSLPAMAEAETALDRGAAEPPAAAWRSRIFQLAEALFQSVRMQLSVPRYQAVARERGATLDNVDVPLNNRLWLKERFAALRKLESERERLQAIDQIANWTNPGPGGFYDDLGNPAQQPHLVSGVRYEDDPGHLRHPLTGFARRLWEVPGGAAWRLSWITDAESMFDAPVEMLYKNLDRSAQYRVRIIYGGERGNVRVIRLSANGRYEVHPFTKIKALTEPMEFDIPREATATGELRLTWMKTPGLPGAGRGCQIAEVWLMRK